MLGVCDQMYSVVRLHLPLHKEPEAFAVIESNKVYASFDGQQVIIGKHKFK
jgi:hypothetical protein